MALRPTYIGVEGAVKLLSYLTLQFMLSRTAGLLINFEFVVFVISYILKYLLGKISGVQIQQPFCFHVDHMSQPSCRFLIIP